jgi:pilus assembly protein CpaB
MKVARIVVLCLAVTAGGTAAFLASRSPDAPAPPPPLPVAAEDTVKILVAAKDISIGQVLSAQDMDWRDWPKASANSEDVRQTAQPDAKEQYAGNLARVPIPNGWPVRTKNLIDAKLKISSAGYMAAILPAGKRAVSMEISADTGAGGFILPQDHVDVILTRRDKEAEKRTSVETFVSETLLKNIPVRAIDQTIEEKNGVRTVVGKIATLELTPPEVEVLARARPRGTLSLSLRSLADDKASSDVTSGNMVIYRGGERTVYNCSPECSQ